MSNLADALPPVLTQHNCPSSAWCCGGVGIVPSPTTANDVYTGLCWRRRVIAELCRLVAVVV